MPVPRDWLTLVDPDVQSRGERYAREGRVHKLVVDDDDRGASAVVLGSSRYRVRVERAPDGQLCGDCDCPYFDEWGEPCKHIWATVVAWLGDDAGRATKRKRRAPVRKTWRQQVEALRHETAASADRSPVPADDGEAEEERLSYVIDTATTLVERGLAVEVLASRRKRNGEWSKPARRGSHVGRPEAAADPDDRVILGLLHGSRSVYGGYYDSGDMRLLAEPVQRTLVKQMCQTGRALLRVDEVELRPLRWDGDGPWRFVAELEPVGADMRLVGRLRRGEATMNLDEPQLMTAGGLVFARGLVSEFDAGGAFEWVMRLRQGQAIAAPAAEAPALVGHLLALPQPPPITAPDGVMPLVHIAKPRIRFAVRPRKKRWATDPETVIGELSFDYGDAAVGPVGSDATIYDEKAHRVVRRDSQAERDAVRLLRRVGFKDAARRYDDTWGPRDHPYELVAKRAAAAINALVVAGWYVEAEGRIHRQATGSVSLSVRSGIDWFELHGDAAFDDQHVPLPRLLEAIRSGERMIRLDDGSMGVLPDEWVAQLASITQLGEAGDDHVRFRPSQAALLDALLAAQGEADVDAAFARARDRLAAFSGVSPADPPPSFVGELRSYQRQGLGWLHFCRRFGFGACLADDMGLGKTVQVLALLEQRAVLRRGEADATRNDEDSSEQPPPPSLVVVPRSLVHNWLAEAARFTPRLRVLDHTGVDRDVSGSSFDAYDLIVTTYGTLRRDAPVLTERRFDYAVLDEAQAIKNAATASAKAARLIKADHRIAMSGTPIENHLGELWSLFEFLNPGMLGRSRAFKALAGGGSAVDADSGGGSESANNEAQSAERRRLIAAAVRPFVLRRTKEQVASDLPPRTEQTIDCPMDRTQRKLYDELRDHYRVSLLKRVASDGIGRSGVHVLEALLRLRQAACHPGLIDPARIDEPSAKVDTLVERLAEVADEGHKALVFSQFTSLLAIVRRRLDADGIVYEYLDGQTRDRAERVERFQSDPACKLFLISLKAGGVGLNLTAADYVFLLDPWWNPAAEQQAIDRTHRIGQTRHVFAYRLITPDSVEQKVLDLQSAKRHLADAIITADKGPLSALTREDLEHLLS